MANPPSTVTYANVVAQFVQFVADTADAGQQPDMIPMGGSITLSPNLTLVPFPGATPNPLTAWQRPITCTLDSEGYLLGPDGVTRGVTVIASDSPNPVGNFTYSVTAALDGGAALSWTLFLVSGTTTDLTTAITVPPLSPSDLEIALASIASTQATMVVDSDIDGSGNLIMTRYNGSTFSAGVAKGAKGDNGDITGNTAFPLANGTIAIPITTPWTLKYTLSGDTTFTIANPANTTSFTLTLVIIQGTTPRNVTWPSGVRWPEGIIPIVPVVASTRHVYNFLWDGGAWEGVVVGTNFA